MLIYVDKMMSYDLGTLSFVSGFQFTKTQDCMVNGRQRLYLTSNDDRLVLIVIHLSNIAPDFRRIIQQYNRIYADMLLDVATGWDSGITPFVPPNEAGRKHTKITIHGIYLPANIGDVLSARPSDTIHTMTDVMSKAPLRVKEVTA